MTGNDADNDHADGYLRYLSDQATDHAARSRQLFDTCTKYLFALNGGGIAIIMGIAGAASGKVRASEFITALSFFSIGLILMTISVYLTWRMSKLYAMRAMDARDKVSASSLAETGGVSHSKAVVDEWFAFTKQAGHDDSFQIAIVLLSFLAFLIGVIAAAASILEMPMVS
jgi:hypothetical protein